MHAPSRRQSLLILGGLGLAAVAGGAYMLENHGSSGGGAAPADSSRGHGRGHGYGDTSEGVEGVEGVTSTPSGDAVPTLALALSDDGAWRPDADGYQAVDDVGQQIKGYASATSANLGESIDFHVSVRPSQSFTIKVFRIGLSGAGKGSELVFTSPKINGSPQSGPKVVEPTRTVVTQWQSSYTLDIPAKWRGGLYVATLENEQKYRSCVPFVVREDGRPKDLLVVLA